MLGNTAEQELACGSGGAAKHGHLARRETGAASGMSARKRPPEGTASFPLAKRHFQTTPNLHPYGILGEQTCTSAAHREQDKPWARRRADQSAAQAIAGSMFMQGPPPPQPDEPRSPRRARPFCICCALPGAPVPTYLQGVDAKATSGLRDAEEGCGKWPSNDQTTKNAKPEDERKQTRRADRPNRLGTGRLWLLSPPIVSDRPAAHRPARSILLRRLFSRGALASRSRRASLFR